jgi:hypothetical protein
LVRGQFDQISKLMPAHALPLEPCVVPSSNLNGQANEPRGLNGRKNFRKCRTADAGGGAVLDRELFAIGLSDRPIKASSTTPSPFNNLTSSPMNKLNTLNIDHNTLLNYRRITAELVTSILELLSRN